jgi:RNA polymerase sigma-B factor
VESDRRRTAEDRILFARYARDRDPGTREQLVERFMPLARRLAMRYHQSGEPLDDLVQVASLGLIKAVDRYNPERGTAFSSFAVPTIVGELKRYFRDSGWAVHVPRGTQESALKVERAIEEVQRKLGRSPSVREIAGHLGKTEEEVLDAMEARSAYHSASLEETLSDDESEGARLDKLRSEEEGYELVDYAVSLEPAWERLSKREQLLLHLRFWEGMTQADIAKRIGVSQMQVSRLLRSTLIRLRASFDDESGPEKG